MKILVDMSLSPAWVRILQQAGYEALHWNSIGASGASDREILAWARDKSHIVFTHDLDFGAILAATKTHSPSVIQLRVQDITPAHASGLVLALLRRFEADLAQGALISVDEKRSRVRLLPIHGPETEA